MQVLVILRTLADELPRSGDVEAGDAGDAVLGVDPGAVSGDADEALAIGGGDLGVVQPGVDGGEAGVEQQAMEEGSLALQLRAVVELVADDAEDVLGGAAVIGDGVGEGALDAEEIGGEGERMGVGLEADLPLLAAVGREGLVGVDDVGGAGGDVALLQAAGAG